MSMYIINVANVGKKHQKCHISHNESPPRVKHDKTITKLSLPPPLGPSLDSPTALPLTNLIQDMVHESLYSPTQSTRLMCSGSP